MLPFSGKRPNFPQEKRISSGKKDPEKNRQNFFSGKLDFLRKKDPEKKQAEFFPQETGFPEEKFPEEKNLDKKSARISDFLRKKIRKTELQHPTASIRRSWFILAS